MATGKQVLTGLEIHCNEKLQCSSRMRFQIEQTIQRYIDNLEGIKQNIRNVADGHNTYNTKDSKVIRRSR